MNESKKIAVSAVNKPERKVIIKRGVRATHYFEYCEEVGCDVWETLVNIKSLLGEPVCLWLPEKYRRENTSEYVQGVEVPVDYSGDVPEGFDVIMLPECTYLMFQGGTFEEATFEQAIGDGWNAMKEYNPAQLGYEWDDENPRIQLEPLCERGYIEYKAVKAIE